MSKLEDLVPPLELCRKIPFLLFEDSVFLRILWRKSRREEVRLRAEVENDPEFAELEDNEEIIIYPAPTLAEIIEALHRAEFATAIFSCGDSWMVKAIKHNINEFKWDEKPAAAALKLWLELNKEKKSEKKGNGND